jgi:hypothetical protein
MLRMFYLPINDRATFENGVQNTLKMELEMKKVRLLIFLIAILMILFVSGCKWSIVSVTGPDCASTGKTVTIYIAGTSESEEDTPSAYGLILQIPNNWVVLSAIAAGSGGSSQNLTENTEYAALYTAEPEHKIWVGTGTEDSSNWDSGTATVRLLIGDCAGQVKAAVGSYRNGAWTADDPSGEFNFSNIDEQKYVHSIECCAWRAQDSTSSLNHLKAVWGSSGSNVFAVGANGTILHYDGSSWSAMTSGTTSNLNGVSGVPGYGVFAVGDNENTITQDIGTGTWVSQTLPNYCSSSELFGVWGGTTSEVFAVGNFRSFFRYYSGSYWNCTQLYGGDMYGIWGSSQTDVFAVGAYISEFWENHPIAHYDGSSWSAMANDTTSSLYGVWGSSGSNVFAVGANGTILQYDGSSWSSMTSGTNNTLRGVWASSATNAFAVGDDGTILHYGPSIALYVNANGQCGGLTPCYSTITTAMNEAMDGDLIKVGLGIYREAPVSSMMGKVTISGGWNNTFSDRTGTSSMYAPRATSGGKLVVQPDVKIIAQ